MATIKEVRDATGMGMGEIRKGMELAQTDDPIFGAAYASAMGLAVNIRGDRHEWNLSYARGTIPSIEKLVRENIRT